METTTLQRSGDVYTDIHGLQNLKRGAENPDEDTLRAVARQFESMLVNMMMKSMRDANAVFEEDSVFQSQETRFFRDMHDQQTALTLSQQGGLGLADTLVRQLSKQLPKTEQENEETTDRSAAQAEWRREVAAADSAGLKPRLQADVAAANVEAPNMGAGLEPRPQASVAAAPVGKPNVGGASAPQAESGEDSGFLPEALKRIDQMVSAVSSFRSPADFVAKLMPLAEHAAGELGASPRALLAQAALETGWGKHVISGNGDSSFNLFNIKADRRWEGDSKAVQTLEFRQGVAEPVRDSFRSYGSYAESFMDYVRFLKDNPRYSTALQKADDPEAFVSELHQAGYATDPAYSSKISEIMNSDLFRQAVDHVKSFADLPISNRGGAGP